MIRLGAFLSKRWNDRKGSPSEVESNEHQTEAPTDATQEKAMARATAGAKSSERMTSKSLTLRPKKTRRAGTFRPAVARPLPVVAVATPSKPPSSRSAKRSKVEIIKENSDFLRHPLMEELVSEATSVSDAAAQLIKFHGSYMQDDREKRTFGAGKYYQFMMRTKQPAGLVSNQLYKTMDDLANEYGNGTLRLTTRQTYQLHGVLKENLKVVFASVIRSMGSTLGACGDVNRNVMAPPAPFKNKPEYVHCQELAQDIADLLAPQSGAYYDVWLDGEKFMSAEMENPSVTEARDDNSNGTNFVDSPEPIYGTQFLPRKFKIAITVPGDNHVDLFTNDLGIVVMHDEQGKVYGYNIVVGGGMGRSHRNNDTFPALAQPLGFVDKEDIFYVVKAIVCAQRDYGRRDDRKQARLKYLLHEWGIDKFRSVVEQYFGKKIGEFKPLPAWEFRDYVGWFDQGDGKLFYGIFVENGRLKGEMKKVLRSIVDKYEIPISLTGNQNIILCDIEPGWKDEIMSLLDAAGVKSKEEVDELQRFSMACPALPLCGLAIAEAERGLPDVNVRLRKLLESLELGDETFVVRMTGCPNGCARPYMAEVGFVGDGPNSYQIWLGGCPNQTRLAEPFMDRMKVDKLEETFEPLFMCFKNNRNSKESFGDFCARFGFDKLREYCAAHSPAV